MLWQKYNNGNNEYQLSEKEYLAKLEEIQDKEQSAFTSMAAQRQAIIQDVTNRYQTEINYINKLIDARKEELQKQKDMYDYDKNLKKQTNEIQLIDQQIRALNGLNSRAFCLIAGNPLEIY